MRLLCIRNLVSHPSNAYAMPVTYIRTHDGKTNWKTWCTYLKQKKRISWLTLTFAHHISIIYKIGSTIVHVFRKFIVFLDIKKLMNISLRVFVYFIMCKVPFFQRNEKNVNSIPDINEIINNFITLIKRKSRYFSSSRESWHRESRCVCVPVSLNISVS